MTSCPEATSTRFRPVGVGLIVTDWGVQILPRARTIRKNGRLWNHGAGSLRLNVNVVKEGTPDRRCSAEVVSVRVANEFLVQVRAALPLQDHAPLWVKPGWGTMPGDVMVHAGASKTPCLYGVRFPLPAPSPRPW